MSLSAMIVVLASLIGVAVGILFFPPHWVIGWVAEANPRVLFEAATPRRAVALTIDDAPSSALTGRILDTLREHGAHATFFVLGDHVPGNEQLLRRMRDEGHEIGNHLMEDGPSVLLSREELRRQLMETDARIRPYGPPRWFRPGSGWFDGRMLSVVESNGYRCCLASIYPHDTKLRRPDLISRYVLDRIRPGAIIVLHDGGPRRESTVQVLDRVLTKLKERGYAVTTVSELVDGVDPAADPERLVDTTRSTESTGPANAGDIVDATGSTEFSAGPQHLSPDQITGPDSAAMPTARERREKPPQRWLRRLFIRLRTRGPLRRRPLFALGRHRQRGHAFSSR